MFNKPFSYVFGASFVFILIFGSIIFYKFCVVNKDNITRDEEISKSESEEIKNRGDEKKGRKENKSSKNHSVSMGESYIKHDSVDASKTSQLVITDLDDSEDTNSSNVEKNRVIITEIDISSKETEDDQNKPTINIATISSLNIEETGNEEQLKELPINSNNNDMRLVKVPKIVHTGIKETNRHDITTSKEADANINESSKNSNVATINQNEQLSSSTNTDDDITDLNSEKESEIPTLTHFDGSNEILTDSNGFATSITNIEYEDIDPEQSLPNIIANNTSRGDSSSITFKEVIINDKNKSEDREKDINEEEKITLDLDNKQVDMESENSEKTETKVKTTHDITETIKTKPFHPKKIPNNYKVINEIIHFEFQNTSAEETVSVSPIEIESKKKLSKIPVPTENSEALVSKSQNDKPETDSNKLFILNKSKMEILNNPENENEQQSSTNSIQETELSTDLTENELKNDSSSLKTSEISHSSTFEATNVQTENVPKKTDEKDVIRPKVNDNFLSPNNSTIDSSNTVIDDEINRQQTQHLALNNYLETSLKELKNELEKDENEDKNEKENLHDTQPNAAVKNDFSPNMFSTPINSKTKDENARIKQNETEKIPIAITNPLIASHSGDENKIYSTETILSDADSADKSVSEFISDVDNKFHESKEETDEEKTNKNNEEIRNRFASENYFSLLQDNESSMKTQ